jgi:hypothetical protein
MVVSHIQAPDVPDVEDALRALNKSGARQGRAPEENDESDRNDFSNFGSDLAPSIVPQDPNDEISAEELANDKPSLGKRCCRYARGGKNLGQRILAHGRRRRLDAGHLRRRDQLRVVGHRQSGALRIDQLGIPDRLVVREPQAFIIHPLASPRSLYLSIYSGCRQAKGADAPKNCSEKAFLLPHIGPAQRYRLDLSEDILALREAQLLPGFLGYARQEPRAGAVLAQGHGR